MAVHGPLSCLYCHEAAAACAVHESTTVRFRSAAAKFDGFAGFSSGYALT